jgi:hypothetical protein
MDNKIIAVSAVILIGIAASVIVLLQLTNQKTVTDKVSEEMLQIENSVIWFGYDFTYPQAAISIYNTRNTPALLQKITVLGIMSEWSDIYYWKGEIGSVSSLSPTSNDLNGSTVQIALDGNERTFQQAQGKIELEPYKAIVLYIKNAVNITPQNIPQNMPEKVTIAVFTERNAYLTEATIEQDWSIAFMDTEQISIVNVQFADAGATITLSVRNTGTADVVINFAIVNGESIDIDDVTVEKNMEGSVTVPYDWEPGQTYQIRLMSTKGNYFPYNAVAP